MARAMPLLYDLIFKVEFETNIRGHHVNGGVWTPILGEQLKCMKDDTEEAKGHDENAICVYKINAENKDLLVGHITCEISKLIHSFLKTDKFNAVVATVTGKRKRKMGLVVPARFKCMAKIETFAKILQKELVKKKNKYSYFELVDEKKIEFF